MKPINAYKPGQGYKAMAVRGTVEVEKHLEDYNKFQIKVHICREERQNRTPI